MQLSPYKSIYHCICLFYAKYSQPHSASLSRSLLAWRVRGCLHRPTLQVVHGKHDDQLVDFGVYPEYTGTYLYGSGSKPCTPGEHQNSW